MRTLGRPAAVAATSVALLLAATGTSLAAVRAARHEAGVSSAGLAVPAPGGRGTQPGSTQPPSDGLTPGPEATLPPAAPGDPAAGLPAPSPTTGAPATRSSGTAAPGAGPGSSGAVPPSRPPTGTSSSAAAINGPANGLTPTTVPGRPAPPSCPSDIGFGALAPGGGDLQAVDMTLPWPGLGPLVLVPQVGATRGTGTAVAISESTIGSLSQDGSSLTVASPVSVAYTLRSGEETARGSIQFGPVGLTASVVAQGCHDRSFAVYDVGRASLDGSPLRIVGFVALTSSITLGGDGGTAHVRATAGTHRITLLTANDRGAAGPLVTITVTVR